MPQASVSARRRLHACTASAGSAAKRTTARTVASAPAEASTGTLIIGCTTLRQSGRKHNLFHPLNLAEVGASATMENAHGPSRGSPSSSDIQWPASRDLRGIGGVCGVDDDIGVDLLR